jgi:hypothetical protein
VLYQLSHASDLRLCSRDFCLVNSSDTKIPAFDDTGGANPSYPCQVELAMQSFPLTIEWTLPGVSWSF